MGYVTPEQISKAKEIDLLTYLRSCDPHELVHVSGGTYCTREHDSLKISNGKWNWVSRGVGGRTATVGRIGSATSADVTVPTPVADVTLPNTALGTLSGAGGTVSVVTEQVENS